MTHKTTIEIGPLSTRDPKDLPPRPIAVPVAEACNLTGLRPTTIWRLIRDGRLETVRVAGVKRTLVVYDSLVRLLTPAGPSRPMPRKPSTHPAGTVSPSSTTEVG
jgi:excisionase family DNA binding protein